MDYLYSAGGFASATHSNIVPENNNAVVSRSGPTDSIVGGSMKDQLNEIETKLKLRIKKLFRIIISIKFRSAYFQKLLHIYT